MLTSAPTILDSLITEINSLYGQLEEAEEVAESATLSAFEFALEIGCKLLQAKAESGHGRWEETRARISSPRSSKSLSSSTATLYQRIAEHGPSLKQAGVCTIRAAAEFLKSDRTVEQSKSATVADLPEGKSPNLEPGQRVVVLDEGSPHYGQEVEVIDASGVIVQASTPDGGIAPFLSTELAIESPAPIERAWADKPRHQPIQQLAAELEICELRLQALEAIVGKLVAAGRAAGIPESLLVEAERLIA